MHGIVQILRLTLFEMTSLDRVLTLVVEGPTQLVDATQLILVEERWGSSELIQAVAVLLPAGPCWRPAGLHRT